eukprot:1160492-Pelagomonas_calceolata.AAC.3
MQDSAICLWLRARQKSTEPTCKVGRESNTSESNAGQRHMLGTQGEAEECGAALQKVSKRCEALSQANMGQLHQFLDQGWTEEQREPERRSWKMMSTRKDMAHKKRSRGDNMRRTWIGKESTGEDIALHQ